MNYKIVLEKMRGHFGSGATRSLESRLAAIDKLERLVIENQDELASALYKDLKKPVQESVVGEFALLVEEIRHTKKRLSKWMQPKKANTPLSLLPARSRIYYEPLGVVLIIGPWNYPFQLMIAPLIGALAAGNCAVLKPSELTPNTSAAISKLIPKYFGEDHVRVVEGGIAETTELLKQRFDHIFFTGSTPVGKIVMEAAAKNLVPVTLELGGKSPVIVCEDADLDLAARRIVWGKCYNAGQTCVAPDYVYVHKTVQEKFMEKLKENINSQFGESPQKSKSFARIVNERNWQRLAKLVDSKNLVVGGQMDKEDLYISPTVLKIDSWTDPVMSDEIFGPILPVLSYDNFSDVLEVIRSKEKPLSAYIFTRSSNYGREFISSVSFGGGCINDVLIHLGNADLPFGGVGSSGMGAYHGHKSFLTFSHEKSVMSRSGFLDLSVRYAPYSDKKLNILKKFFRMP